MRLKLETVSNWMIVITGAAVTLFTVSRYVNEQRQPALMRPAPQEYQVGEKLAAGFPVDFSQAPQTLLMVLSSKCHFCSESTPFYREMLSARPINGPATRVVAIGLEQAATLEEYVKQEQLAVDAVASIPREKLKFRGTPTLLLVDRSGTVTAIWGGFLSTNERKQQVLRVLKTGHA